MKPPTDRLVMVSGIAGFLIFIAVAFVAGFFFGKELQLRKGRRREWRSAGMGGMRVQRCAGMFGELGHGVFSSACFSVMGSPDEA